MTKEAKNHGEVRRLFKEGRSPYAIHIQTGLSIKEVYHYIRVDEEIKHNHKKLIAEQKECYVSVNG